MAGAMQAAGNSKPPVVMQEDNGLAAERGRQIKFFERLGVMMSLRKALILGFVCSLVALPGFAQAPQTPQAPSSGPAATVSAPAPQ